ncbi:leucine-rich repeat domain-containing protein [Candidatus Clostridium radicumherbarum]|uniref:Leucine-rich repeat domain-containing protein n=1 Tax=Candidatus Clostridium radicumherbarum TaxID=3381662 RepID=A0ABW8TTE5_9CLOT
MINSNIVIPSSVSLNKTMNTLTVDDTDTLIATVSPSNATNKNVQWSTSNSNVATVDEAGKVTAIGVGTATITATTIDGNKAASCTITVTDIVTFKDKNLEQAVRNAINKPTGTIFKSDVAHITYLHLYNKNISDISGIENLSSLQTLDLENNQISDISAMNGLTNLQFLNLDLNGISDISALKELTNLQDLYLDSNRISDFSALKGLINLKYLKLIDNQISDISVLKELTNLQELYLSNNEISDISALRGLTNLHQLELMNNQISDINALTGLTNLLDLGLTGNQISAVDQQKLKTALPNCEILF